MSQFVFAQNVSESADLQCSNEYDPALSYPKVDKQGKLGLIGAPCSDAVGAHLIEGQCVALNKCKGETADGKPLAGLPDVPNVTPTQGAGALSLNPTLLDPDAYVTTDSLNPAPVLNTALSPNAFAQPIPSDSQLMETFSQAPYGEVMNVPYVETNPDTYGVTTAFNNNYLSSLGSQPPTGADYTLGTDVLNTPAITAPSAKIGSFDSTFAAFPNQSSGGDVSAPQQMSEGAPSLEGTPGQPYSPGTPSIEGTPQQTYPSSNSYNSTQTFNNESNQQPETASTYPTENKNGTSPQQPASSNNAFSQTAIPQAGNDTQNQSPLAPNTMQTTASSQQCSLSIFGFCVWH